ncbi:cell division transport system ATP-binding protein [Alkalibacterium putridalgicola]|uniref:Cell division ATP-binding protein FtsE n=1 Tax=Alkalibacterium putridalgicola TaxID=426703 RepID=A0A1H7T6F3_9LACT|nr:ATP-binding cassette domain-containing protein [Alkalibacterium putridalgicola]GEK89337.1 cell division ATP-binding protein FtsE [Alkalibacterium putridalgicola]SEL80373.1 cell division transport system ATP-binding protein [Alkalibacterium putridalgicola]
MIRLKNISHMYDEFDGYIVKDISCDIEQGEFVYLTGPARSGKTTFLKIISGQLKASKGLLSVHSHYVNKMKRRKAYLLKRQIGAVFLDLEFLMDKTVYENVAYVLEVIEYPSSDLEERVLDTLALVGLKYKALDAFSNCTLEERRRIAIARAIVHDPSILVVDEPTRGLDYKPEINMLNLLHKLNKQGMTVVMATQKQELIERMPARMLEMEKGKVIRDRSKNHMLFILSNKMGEYYIS